MKLVRWLFLMPMLCLLLILVPTGALAEEIKDTSEGNVPVTIIDDTTGASPANGTVTLPDYIYYQNATYPYYVDRGDTVTLNVVPDEGYEIGDLRVTYKKIEAGSDLDLALDEETSSFTLPARGCVSVTIHVTFVRPGGVYGIDTNIVERSSGRVTGNTVELDKTTASPGETVVFNVVMNPGTQFYDLGEDRSYPYVGYLAADNSHVYVDLDQVDEDT